VLIAAATLACTAARPMPASVATPPPASPRPLPAIELLGAHALGFEVSSPSHDPHSVAEDHHSCASW
jgi:hypothetical protein